MSWNVKYVVLILFSTAVTYLGAILVSKTNNTKLKKTTLAMVLVTCLGILGVFKYFNFFVESFVQIINSFGLNINTFSLNLLLPVGISFYTFQTLSYFIDVYQKKCEFEKNFFKYATFVSFFPQLVAGPIERTTNLLPQITKEHKFNYKNSTYGLKLMAWGLFKKIVIADSLSIFVDKIYTNISSFRGLSLIIATIFFAIQIYCDFSGYSDIAIGVSHLFDIKLMKNFASPYFSSSIKEFWGRWHISLSTWFKDYVYIPLGGNRCSKLRNSINLLITFLVSGLWHGANWTFVIWGIIHGLGQIAENLLGINTKKKNPLKIIFSTCLVLVFVICGWVFFRAETITDAIYVFKNCLVGISDPVAYVDHGLTDIGLSDKNIFDIALPCLLLLLYDFFSLKFDVIEKISNLRLVPRWSIYILFVIFILCMLPNNSGGEFIYFQF